MVRRAGAEAGRFTCPTDTFVFSCSLAYLLRKDSFLEGTLEEKLCVDFTFIAHSLVFSLAVVFGDQKS